MKTLMNRLWTMLLVLGATLSITACQPGPEEQNGGGTTTPPVNTELAVKFVNMLHMPFEVTSADKVNVSAKVTVSNGLLTEVLLNYIVSEGLIQGDPQSVKMENSGVGLYNADIPAQPGKAVVKYWITARGTNADGENFEWESDFGNYIVAEDPDEGDDGKDDGSEGEDTPPVVAEDPCKKVRLNEISTGASLGEFVEIYNTGSEDVNLKGVAIYKNLDYEEPLVVLDDVVLPAGGYGVLFAKGVTATLPEGCINLGVTDRGLASSRALCVELGRDAGATIYDVYTNTINPNTEATDWNTDGVEFEANFFARFTDGWYSAGILTPGDLNLEPDTKLKHQKNVALAVSDAPYVANVSFTPTSITTGKSLTVSANVYTDAYSNITKVQCVVGNSTIELTKGEGDVYTGTHTFSAEGNYTATVTASNNDNRKGTLSQGVTVLPAGTEFASQAAVRLNEINPDRKYIELYNTSSKPVNMVGMYIEKNNEDILLHIKDNIIIEGNQYAVLACGGKDYSSTEYLYLGSSDKGLSGKKSLCIEWMATVPEKVRIDAFCNTKDTDPRPKVTVWDAPSGVEVNISDFSAGRYPDGQVVNPTYPDKLPNEWLIFETSTLGYSNKSATRRGRLRNQMTTIAPVPTDE